MVREAKTEELVSRITWFGLAPIALAFFLMAPTGVRAASLYLSPASKSLHVGQTFIVTVDVSSADQAMNAVSGDIAFPSGRLQVLSTSKRNSIIGLWVRDPSFTNSAAGGNVHFEGVVLNPGFTGAVGPVVNIVFQAISPGKATVSFSDGAVLANNGNGTNILTGMQSAVFTITPAVVASSTPPAPPDTTPPDPFAVTEIPASISDPTNPHPIFTWSTTDASSGIDKYLVKIGDGDWFDASSIRVATSVNWYALPYQAPGVNVLLQIDAYDTVGNIQSASTTFTVSLPPPPPFNIENWFWRMLEWLFNWAALILIALLLACLIAALLYIARHRFLLWRLRMKRDLVEARKELRDDLVRIDKELSDSPIPIPMERKQEIVREEVGHIEDDLKKDLPPDPEDL
jgi:hypothetical protein